MTTTYRSSAGFSLVEVLVAAAVLATTLTGVAHLLAVAEQANRTARAVTIATLLAASKMEELHAGRDTSLSAAGSLDSNVSGYYDVFDTAGRPLGDLSSGEGAAFVRRWAVVPDVVSQGRVIRVEVIVTPWVGVGPSASVAGLAGTVRLVGGRPLMAEAE